jgi:cell division protein FtsZ
MPGSRISVTIIATGFNAASIPELYIRKPEPDRIHLTEISDTEHEDGDVFVLRDASLQKTEMNSPSQRTIEFDLNMVEDDFYKEISRVRKPIDTQKAGDRVSAIKRTHEELKELKQSVRQTDREIEELENTPAFKRKHIQIDPKKYSDETKVSQYTLSDDENSQVKLSRKNSYLHGAVD